MVQYLIKYAAIMKRVRFLLYIDTSTRPVNIKVQFINEDSIMCQWAASSVYKASFGDTTPPLVTRGYHITVGARWKYVLYSWIFHFIVTLISNKIYVAPMIYQYTKHFFIS